MLFLDRLKKYNHKLTKSKKLVSDYIVNNMEKATYLTATKIGLEAGVSDTTVIRLAISLGYKNFSEMQESIQNEYMNNRTIHRLTVSNNEIGENNAIIKSFNTDISNIQKLLENINIDDFEKAVKLIYNAEKVYTVGFRSSSADAYYLGFSLQTILGNTRPVTTTGYDVEECLQSADENSIIIAFSFSRYPKNTVEVVKYLKNEANSQIISITDSINSPIAKYSDLLFIVPTEAYTHQNSHIASMALINAIISAVGQSNIDTVKERLNKLENYYKKSNIFNSE